MNGADGHQDSERVGCEVLPDNGDRRMTTDRSRPFRSPTRASLNRPQVIHRRGSDSRPDHRPRTSQRGRQPVVGSNPIHRHDPSVESTHAILRQKSALLVAVSSCDSARSDGSLMFPLVLASGRPNGLHQQAKFEFCSGSPELFVGRRQNEPPRRSVTPPA